MAVIEVAVRGLDECDDPVAAFDVQASARRLAPAPAGHGARRRGHLDTPVYARAGLHPGDTISSPAIVEEYGSTLPLHPGFHANVDRHGNLVVSSR